MNLDDDLGPVAHPGPPLLPVVLTALLWFPSFAVAAAAAAIDHLARRLGRR